MSVGPRQAARRKKKRNKEPIAKRFALHVNAIKKDWEAYFVKKKWNSLEDGYKHHGDSNKSLKFCHLYRCFKIIIFIAISAKNIIWLYSCL